MVYVNTLKFLLFVGAFVGITGLLLPLISNTAGSAEFGDIEYAMGDTSTLYVMKTPTNYVRTLFSLNPTSDVVVSQLRFYFYADHDTTWYYGATENNFTLYVDITNPNSGASQTENWENFNPAFPHDHIQLGFSLLENVNLAWPENYSAIIDVANERSISAGNIKWTFPITVKSEVVLERVSPTLFEWMTDYSAWGAAAVWIGGSIADGARSVIGGVFTAIVGQDIANMVGSFLHNMSRVLTMDFGGIPEVLRLMIALPIWMGIGYISLIIIRSFIPTIGGGSEG